MNTNLSAVRIGGALLPADILSAVLTGTLDGLGSSDYHLAGEAPRAAAARVWTHLLGVYRRFREDLAKRPDGDPAVGLTRERWLTALLSEFGYGRVPAVDAGGIVLGDKAYPVSHLWGAVPIHLLGWNVPLDTRTPGVAGAARAPHAMLQDLLNRDDTYLWGMLSNGRALRLLRDSTSLVGQAYVEFDLEAIFDGELFAEFALLFLLAHQSRVEVPTGGKTTDCWLERWRTTAVSQGVRALSLLRDGVQEALEILGTGFLQHPANVALRDDLAAGRVTLENIHSSLLRTVYRLLFWFVADDRAVLLAPDADPVAADRYEKHFSSRRLRDLASRRHGTPHHDLWQATSIVLAALGRVEGDPRLGLPGLGGLFLLRVDDVLHVPAPPGADEAAQASRPPYQLSNQALLAAVRALSLVQPKGQPRRRVDFRHLGAEELGSIYESLLELVPRFNPHGALFTLETLAGNDRKTSGSYYTPSELVELVLDTALDPVLDDAEKADDPEQALLSLTVCDPAIGSGHFMVAAARRIATRLAAVRTQEIDPTPTDVQIATHDVVSRCIYGVDLNPMAADLAKVSLWLEAIAPGRPLSFLDHHIKVGNALLGTTPALLAAGIPDTAYTALTGDDKATVTAWRKANTAERGRQGALFGDVAVDVSNAGLRAAAQEVAARAATARSLADIAWAAQRFTQSRRDPAAIRARRVADGWCAAFLSPKTTGDVPITQATVEALTSDSASPAVVEVVDALAARHRLFHWHLEFPDVFPVPDAGPTAGSTGWTGGFSAVLGNPPWERVKLQEQEFFAARDETIAKAKNAAARKDAITALAESNPALLAEFTTTKRAAEAESQFLRGSGRYPLCGVGDVNTYSVFAEHFRTMLAPTGRSGIITPTGLATDATTASFFADTLRSKRLAALYDFENEDKIFEGVHNQFRFAVTCMSGGEPITDVSLAFYTRFVADTPLRRFALAADEILLLNPNTGTLPVFRTRKDAEITLACYSRHPVLVLDHVPGGNAWGLHFGTLMHMANDSAHFATVDEFAAISAEFDGWAWRSGDQEWLPLYEAKLLGHWNHRFATYADATEAQLNKGTLPRLDQRALDDPEVEPLARYWVARDLVDEAVPASWDRQWLFGWRDIARASDSRTFVPSVLPRSAVGHVFPIAFTSRPRRIPLLQSIWSSIVFDYIARQKISGTHMTYGIVNQLPCPRPEDLDITPAWLGSPLADFLRVRVLELTYTSSRIRPYAEDVVDADPGAPFRWVPERREQLRAELDAAMFHVYGLDRSDTEHVIDSFFVVRKNEEKEYGDFRTKRLVLAAYDAMAEAATAGSPFVSPLDPPPGHGPRHPAR